MTTKPATIKVHCDFCRARYSLPEERVRGRVLKIRCKNCQKVFEVRAATPPKPEKSLIARGKRWFMVIKKERVGPVTAQEVRERFQRGEIKTSTYIWRQGFEKWLRLKAVDDFVDLLGEEATQATGAPPAVRQVRQTGSSDAIIPRATQQLTNLRATLQNEAMQAQREEAQREEAEADLAPGGLSLQDTAVVAYRAADSDGEVRAEYVDRQTGNVVGDDYPEESDPGEAVASALVDSSLHATHVHVKGDQDPRDGLAEGSAFEAQLGEISAPVQSPLRASTDDEVTVPQVAAASATPAEDAGLDPAESWMASVEQRAAEKEAMAVEFGDDVEQEDLDDDALKGQRRENSVLFSLPHLIGVAKPVGAVEEIAEELPDGVMPVDGFEIPEMDDSGAPMLLPDPEEIAAAQRKGGAGRTLLVGFLGVLVGAGALVGGLYLIRPDLVQQILHGASGGTAAGTSAKLSPIVADGGKTATPKVDAVAVAKSAAATADAAVATAEKTPDAGAPVPDAKAVASSTPDARAVKADTAPVAVAAKKSDRRAERRRRDRRAERRRRKANRIAVVDPDSSGDPPSKKADPPEDAPDPPTKAADPPTKKPRGKKPPAKRPPVVDDPPAKKADPPKAVLDRAAFNAGMRKASAAVKVCQAKHKAVGIIRVSVTVGSSGAIVSGKVLGMFDGTDIGNCVLSASKKAARFATFSGPSVTMRYPWVLR